MKSKRNKIVPDEDDWRPYHEQKKKDKICNRIQECHEPGCGRPGCLTWWLEKKDKINLTGFKVLVVLHAHHLYPTFEQRRNYNHVIRDNNQGIYRVRYKPSEIRTSIKLKSPHELPDFIMDKFKVNKL